MLLKNLSGTRFDMKYKDVARMNGPDNGETL